MRVNDIPIVAEAEFVQNSGYSRWRKSLAYHVRRNINCRSASRFTGWPLK
jgi:hypothetical protein